MPPCMLCYLAYPSWAWPTADLVVILDFVISNARGRVVSQVIRVRCATQLSAGWQLALPRPLGWPEPPNRYSTAAPIMGPSARVGPCKAGQLRPQLTGAATLSHCWPCTPLAQLAQHTPIKLVIPCTRRIEGRTTSQVAPHQCLKCINVIKQS